MQHGPTGERQEHLSLVKQVLEFEAALSLENLVQAKVPSDNQ